MTTTASKGGLRAAATERRTKHAQRTPLPPRSGQVESAREPIDAPPSLQYGGMDVTALKAVAKGLSVRPIPRTKGALLEAILKAERAEGKVDQQFQEPAKDALDDLLCVIGTEPREAIVQSGEHAGSVVRLLSPTQPTESAVQVTNEGFDGVRNLDHVQTKSAGKAERFAADVRALGWTTEFIHDCEQTEAISRRGEESIYQRWIEGVYQHPATYTYLDWTIQIRNASAGRKRAALPPEQGEKDRGRVAANKRYKRKATDSPRRSLPFDPALATDIEVIEALRGRGVVWMNKQSNNTETAVMNRDAKRIEIAEAPDGGRLVKFCCPITGYRAFNLSALLTVGASNAKPKTRRAAKTEEAE